jgi:hypothetical protein
MRTRYRRHGRLYDGTSNNPAGIQNIDVVDAAAGGFSPSLVGSNPLLGGLDRGPVFDQIIHDEFLARQAARIGESPAPGVGTNPFLAAPGQTGLPDLAPINSQGGSTPELIAAPRPTTGAESNPARLEAAQIGGAPSIPGAGGPVTATPGIPSAAEQLGNSLDLSSSPALAKAIDSGVNLDVSPEGDLRQLQATNRGAPMSVDEPPAAAPDPIAKERTRRRGGKRQQLVQQAAGAADEANLGYLPADLGLGDWITRQSAKAAAGIHPTGAAGHTLKGALAGGGKLLGMGVKALPWVAVAAQPVMGAMEGAQSGSGGAAIQGGASVAGAAIGGFIGSAVPGLGTAIGAGIGGMIGNAVGGMGRQAAVSAVEAAQGGDTGLSGQIGRSLDGVIDTPMEVESRQMVAQMNSPAVLAIKAEERQRSAAQRAQAAQDLLMQAYARGLS